MTKESHVGRKLALGALIAGATGYLAGILTAPKSGKETRKDISDKASEYKEDAIVKIKAAQADLSDVLDKAKSKTIALSAKAREEFNEAVIKAKDAQTKLTAVLSGVKAGKSDQPELDEALAQAKQSYKNLAKFLKS